MRGNGNGKEANNKVEHEAGWEMGGSERGLRRIEVKRRVELGNEALASTHEADVHTCECAAS